VDAPTDQQGVRSVQRALDMSGQLWASPGGYMARQMSERGFSHPFGAAG
jgi:hypothetical protein